MSSRILQRVPPARKDTSYDGIQEGQAMNGGEQSDGGDYNGQTKR